MNNTARLTAFYSAYNPEKISEIAATLAKYKGRENVLFASLVKKYGPEPTEESEATTPADSTMDHKNKNENHAGAGAEKCDAVISSQDLIAQLFQTRLKAFYHAYNPDKMSEITTVLTKYKGKEDALFNALVKKYGPEPFTMSNDQDDESENEGATNSDEEEDKEDEEDTDRRTTSSPVEMLYCPIDTLPPEFCEYGPCFDECKSWLFEHCPELFLLKYNRTVAELIDVETQIAAGVEGITLEVTQDKKKNKRKIGIKDKSSRLEGQSIEASAKCVIEHVSRSKKKSITLLTGLDAFQIKLKEAAKLLGKKFACSASVNKLDTGGFQIQLQGNVSGVLADLLPDMFSIPPNRIFYLEKTKLQAAF